MLRSQLYKSSRFFDNIMHGKEQEPSRFYIDEQARNLIKQPAKIKEKLLGGEMPYQILGFSDEVIEEFYQASCFLLGEKRYRESANAFLFLVGLDPYQYDFWIGLGMSEQLCHEYETAIDAYEIAAICNLMSPVPYFYLAKCLFAIHDRQSALEALRLAIEMAEEDDQYKEIKEQAEIAKKTLESI